MSSHAVKDCVHIERVLGHQHRRDLLPTRFIGDSDYEGLPNVRMGLQRGLDLCR